MTSKHRYALVGTGGRCVPYIDSVVDTYKDNSELVGLCDLSQTRMDWHNQRIKKQFGHDPIPTYLAANFDKMVKQTRADTVIVTSMDATHHQYIIRAMELGCDVISEKPMTTDAEKAKAILDAIDRTGQKLRVTFNFRYTPQVTKVKELMMNGVVGKPTAVDLSWVLDTSHGADYFHRWHATKANSGGLLVHKATHHFDLVNWLIDSWPRTIFAMGDLKFYGRKNAEARGESYSYDRYTGHKEAAKDPFAIFLDANDRLKGLYLDAEKDSGYIRDRNVFGDHIDIEDTIAVMCKYRNQVIMNYSLVAYCPWEGLRLAITGDKGRIELFDQHGSHIISGQDDKQLAADQARNHQKKITVFPMFGQPYDVAIPKADGAHGGGDPLIYEQLFSPNPPADPYHRAAGPLHGAASMLVGASANVSIATGKVVQCDDLLALPEQHPEPTAAS